MNGRLAGKVAMVTGAASGIGRATADIFKQNGATVAYADSNGDSLKHVAVEIAGASSNAIQMDVSNEADWKRATDQIIDRHGRFDILVNCAGISAATPIEDLSLDEWRRVMAVNLDGVFLGTKYAIAAMRRIDRRGCIINVASTSGVKARPEASAYCTSKAAVIMFSKAIAMECARRGDAIRVNAISPTGIKTPLWRTMPFFQQLIAEHGSEEAAYCSMEDGTPLGRFAAAEEVAAAILYLASDEAGFITGTNLLFDNGDSA